MKKHIVLFVVLFVCNSMLAQERFSFAFLTDIHLNNNPEAKSFDGLAMAIMSVKNSGSDFILTGGDNVDADGMKADQKDKAMELYSKFKNLIDASALKWNITIGNHDRYWHDNNNNYRYGESLFISFFGNTYYTFDHKGWRFIILNSTEVCDGKYCMGEGQTQWLKELIAATPAEQPVIISVHVPFLSLYYPVLEGKYTDTDTFINQKQVFDLFEGHNLKLVLQGHQHLYEEIKVKGVQFITAGAVSAAWWGGEFHGTQEGYLLVHCDDKSFDWEYIDYGWTVLK